MSSRCDETGSIINFNTGAYTRVCAHAQYLHLYPEGRRALPVAAVTTGR